MQDFFNLVMLACAALGSMGLGVLSAYALCRSAFHLMHWHSQQADPAVKPSTKVVRAS